jgi:hypothetical protein
MSITIIFVVLTGLVLWLMIGYKGGKETKNKPPNVK